MSFLAVIILSITMLADAVYFNDPRHRDESLKAWMTPRYVALSYDLPPPVVRELLGIEKGADHPRRLDRLAENMGLSLDELTQKIRQASAQLREQTGD